MVVLPSIWIFLSHTHLGRRLRTASIRSKIYHGQPQSERDSFPRVDELQVGTLETLHTSQMYTPPPSFARCLADLNIASGDSTAKREEKPRKDQRPQQPHYDREAFWAAAAMWASMK